jgi:4-hydroxy-tetrahydrodipicolinate reductase
MLKLAIFGAAGRMGGALIRCAARAGDVRVVAAVEQDGNPAIGLDAGQTAGSDPIGTPIVASADGAGAADVLVDFTFHAAVPAQAGLAARLGKPLVVGTTGLTDGEREALRVAARRVPVVWSPNMSLGVNLLFALAERAASVLGPGYRVEIAETHHAHKKDAPSGTALRLGEQVAAGRGQDFRAVMVHNPPGPAEVPPDRIVVRSRREGEVIGDHAAAFDCGEERVELTHRARSRDAFATGALCAARWAVGRTPALYDMQDVLGLRTLPPS